MCLGCSTVCGMIATVQDGRILKLDGNPRDPNSRGKLCAKGQAAINMVEDPDRLLHPLRRTGARGAGLWERIGWDEAIATLVARLRPLREAKTPERLMLLYGRDRTNGLLERFTDAFGTPHKLGHRGLCSLNKRMAIRASIGDTDWETSDFENSRYILNFGSNFFEAHQGHIGMLSRVASARRAGATLVTFDVRLSNTAAGSDRWVPVFPGTDGAVALAIGHVILEEGLADRRFLDDWTNAPYAAWREHYRPYTPAFAEAAAGVDAATIVTLAREFAAAAPRATTVSNRGTHAHPNGFFNEWAVTCLNAIVGSIGAEGGWCYIPGDVNRSAPQPGPLPPKAAIRTQLSHPDAYPLVNELAPRAVSSHTFGEIGHTPIDVLLSYYVNPSMTWPLGPTAVRDVLLDEERIPFHAAIDAFPSEHAELADLVLPDATFLERWDLDARNSYELQPYVGLRQPVVPPAGECRDIREILGAVARALDPEMARYFVHESAREFVEEWARAVPGGLAALQETGVWIDESAPRAHRPYLWPVDVDLRDGATRLEGDLVFRDGSALPVARRYGAGFVRGFATRDRRFQFELARIAELWPDGRHPTRPAYRPIADHATMADDEFVLVTFKWNVHTQSRTANQPWLMDIVGDNPMWINDAVARELHIAHGQPCTLVRPSEADAASLEVRAQCTAGIHPRVVAISASFGHRAYGRTARGHGVNPNGLIPSWADPVGGGQAWNDTIVRVRAAR